MTARKTETDSLSMIERYRETGDISIRNDIVLRNIGIVRYAAMSMRNMFAKFGDIDDVINEGVICLINAVETYDETKGAKFETYATLKVRGGLIDYIRRQDWVPRAVRKFSKDLSAAFSELYAILNRAPTDDELAERMGISLDKLEKGMAQSAAAVTLSLEELLYEDNFENYSGASGAELTSSSHADSAVFEKERRDVVKAAVESLSEKEYRVISLYYFKRLKFSDIAKIIGVTESRISQIHTKAILTLKAKMEEYYE